MKTTQLIDAAKARQGIPSDYAMAQRMGITRSQMSRYRTGADYLSDEQAMKVAELAEIDPASVLLWVHIERARTPEQRAAWERAADKLTRAAVAALVLLGVGFVGLIASPDASAMPSARAAAHASIHYVKSCAQRKRAPSPCPQRS